MLHCPLGGADSSTCGRVPEEEVGIELPPGEQVAAQLAKFLPYHLYVLLHAGLLCVHLAHLLVETLAETNGLGSLILPLWSPSHSQVSRDGSSTSCPSQGPCWIMESHLKGKDLLPQVQTMPVQGGQRQALLRMWGDHEYREPAGGTPAAPAWPAEVFTGLQG